MTYATTRSVSLHGAVGHVIDVQADVSNGVVGTVLVGRPDAALHEARDRVKMAISNSDLPWPTTRRTTILLSPADLPKSGTHFDLAMAVAVLAANGGLPGASVGDVSFIGELSLDGRLRPVPGVLPMVLALTRRGVRTVFVPDPQVDEARMVPGVEVYGARSLKQVVALLQGEPVPEAPPVAEMSGSRLLAWRGETRREEVDFADLFGLADVRFAVEVAAAGGHHLLLSGPKGSGKTSVAERIPTVLPDLERAEAVELTAVHSLAGALEPGDGLIVRPPYSAPHHDASKASLVGGGNGQVRPGEISRAHHGVLFLDEFPLFRSDVIDALREPLESGEITVARAEELATLPARCMVVLASNPCPCGNYHPGNGGRECECTQKTRREYMRRVKAPLVDRIDITRHLSPPQAHGSRDRFDPRESSAEVRERVTGARQRQAARYAGETWRLNGHAPGPALRDRWPLTDEGDARLAEEVYQGRLTQRGAARVHRMAWTLADLAGRDRPGLGEIDVALALRKGEALTLPIPARRAG